MFRLNAEPYQVATNVLRSEDTARHVISDSTPVAVNTIFLVVEGQDVDSN
jgi:hypothetical protein